MAKKSPKKKTSKGVTKKNTAKKGAAVRSADFRCFRIDGQPDLRVKCFRNVDGRFNLGCQVVDASECRPARRKQSAAAKTAGSRRERAGAHRKAAAARTTATTRAAVSSTEFRCFRIDGQPDLRVKCFRNVDGRFNLGCDVVDASECRPSRRNHSAAAKTAGSRRERAGAHAKPTASSGRRRRANPP